MVTARMTLGNRTKKKGALACQNVFSEKSNKVFLTKDSGSSFSSKVFLSFRNDRFSFNGTTHHPETLRPHEEGGIH